jgi:hypothetical protein
LVKNTGIQKSPTFYRVFLPQVQCDEHGIYGDGIQLWHRCGVTEVIKQRYAVSLCPDACLAGPGNMAVFRVDSGFSVKRDLNCIAFVCDP